MSSNIKLFCDNIFNYDYLKNIRTDKKILIKFAQKSLEKYANDKNSIYYRRAFVLKVMLSNLPKTYEFFFAIFNQPYLNKYVYSSNFNEIKSFIKSKYDLYDTVMYIKSITLHSDEFNHLTLEIIDSTNAVCISPRWFYTYTRSEAKIVNKNKVVKYDDKISNFYGFAFLTDLNVNVIDKIINERKILTENINGLLQNKIKNDLKTKECINSAKNGSVRFVYYEISWIIENTKNLKYFETSGGPILHRSNVILDFVNYKDTKIVDVLYMETSIVDNPNWYNVEEIFLDSIKNDIRSNLELECNIITFDSESCPRINIQGDYGTCAIWSLYLFYLYTFYPSRLEIFNMLNKINIRSKNDILLFFIFFVYKTCRKFIKRSERVQNIDIDLRNNCTLIN